MVISDIVTMTGHAGEEIGAMLTFLVIAKMIREPNRDRISD